jgi:hypothetical protein
VARDDQWGSGGSPFTSLSDPSDGKAGRLVATNVTFSDSLTATLGGIRLDNDLNIAVDPTNSSTVYIVWCDNTGPSSTLRVRRSVNRGRDWSTDLLTADNATLATMTCSSRGQVGLFYQQLVAGKLETHFRTTFDGAAWDDTLLARTADPGPFAGDYARLVSVGPNFYGVFPAMNTPDPANFFPNGGGTFTFQRNTSGGNLVGGDGVTVIAPSLDPFFFKVEERTATWLLQRSTFGQDEIDARRSVPRGTPNGLPIHEAFELVVDGFTAGDLGISPGSTLSVPSPPGLVITCTGNTSDTGGYGPELQRFTFHYDVDFPDDSAFSFSTPTRFDTLSATVGGVNAFAQIELIKQPNPFILHGDPPYLSVDLRVFVVRAGETRFGVTMGDDASAAPGFIQQVMSALTAGQGTAGGQSFGDLAVDESARLFINPFDNNDTPVFNFALAKVHYIGLIGANNVRVFFRLLQAQSTSTAFNPATAYRTAPSNPHGQPIPLAGIQGQEYVTVPCFASDRIDPLHQGMQQQTDDPNIQNFTAVGGGEVDRFYGCWLDMNQPFKVDGTTPRIILPLDVPSHDVDGPFNDPTIPLMDFQQVIIRNPHQCLIAEIDFDPVPIPFGKDPSNWDKLAQRNIAFSDIGSAEALTTFEVRPTPAGLPSSQPPDELMIDWREAPSGHFARIFLPGVDATETLALASKLYASHRLTRVDDHTIGCRTGGITYIPVPPTPNDVNYAGLLSVDFGSSIKQGEVFNVSVSQVTNASNIVPPPPAIAIRSAAEAFAVAELEWRKVIGAFQLTVGVKPRHLLLLDEERLLATLRWIALSLPTRNRWYPVFQRYLDAIADRVKTFGGDPGRILPSPIGDVRPKGKREERQRYFTGKINGLVFDRFGDFEGFVLDTEDGERRFFNREREVEHLAERAWRERLRVTVVADADEPRHFLSIILRQPPAPFS